MSFYSETEVGELGFAGVGRGVRVSRLASFHGIERITIGDHSRIDDFCVLSAGEGGISIGSHVHVAVMGILIGRGRILLEDFCNISGRVSIYSSTDDFGGNYLTGPMVPVEHINVDSRPVRLARHVIIGAGSVVLPGTDARTGAAVGALSLVKGVLEEFTMYAGVPAVRIRDRERGLLAREATMNGK